jgi:hypothetical protein
MPALQRESGFMALSGVTDVEVFYGHGSGRFLTRHYTGAEIGCAEIGVAYKKIVL